MYSLTGTGICKIRIITLEYKGVVCISEQEVSSDVPSSITSLPYRSMSSKDFCPLASAQVAARSAAGSAVSIFFLACLLLDVLMQRPSYLDRHRRLLSARKFRSRLN